MPTPLLHAACQKDRIIDRGTGGLGLDVSQEGPPPSTPLTGKAPIMSTVRHLASPMGAIDPIWGERVVAFVSRRPNHAVTAEELIAFVAKRLAPYKVPEEVVFLEDLPKNATRKVNRRALRERYVAVDRQVEQA
jgi:acyl-CoA synthetase (AMP-forming)/AMP-acid ligase II